MGHVLLVIAPPRSVMAGSDEANTFEAAWPHGDVRELWVVRTVESTRREKAGLHEVDTLLYVQPGIRRLIMVGEYISDRHELSVSEQVAVDLWQSPPELRPHLSPSIMAQVVTEMTENRANWSTLSAIRAVLRSPTVHLGADMMEEIQDCWENGPICTTVVIAFWQRYLVKLSEISNGSCDAADVIHKWMPLKADRTLPDELLTTMHNAGWVPFTRVPRLGQGLQDVRPVNSNRPPSGSVHVPGTLSRGHAANTASAPPCMTRVLPRRHVVLGWNGAGMRSGSPGVVPMN